MALKTNFLLSRDADGVDVIARATEVGERRNRHVFHSLPLEGSLSAYVHAQRVGEDGSTSDWSSTPILFNIPKAIESESGFTLQKISVDPGYSRGEFVYNGKLYLAGGSSASNLTGIASGIYCFDPIMEQSEVLLQDYAKKGVSLYIANDVMWIFGAGSNGDVDRFDLNTKTLTTVHTPMTSLTKDMTVIVPMASGCMIFCSNTGDAFVFDASSETFSTASDAGVSIDTSFSTAFNKAKNNHLVQLNETTFISTGGRSNKAKGAAPNNEPAKALVVVKVEGSSINARPIALPSEMIGYWYGTAAAAVDNKLFIFGGNHYDVDSSKPDNWEYGYWYADISNLDGDITLTHVASLPTLGDTATSMHGCSAIASGHFIYILGGTIPTHGCVNFVMRFDVDAMDYSYIVPMLPAPNAYFNTAALYVKERNTAVLGPVVFDRDTGKTKYVPQLTSAFRNYLYDSNNDSIYTIGSGSIKDWVYTAPGDDDDDDETYYAGALSEITYSLATNELTSNKIADVKAWIVTEAFANAGGALSTLGCLIDCNGEKVINGIKAETFLNDVKTHGIVPMIGDNIRTYMPVVPSNVLSILENYNYINPDYHPGSSMAFMGYDKNNMLHVVAISSAMSRNHNYEDDTEMFAGPNIEKCDIFVHNNIVINEYYGPDIDNLTSLYDPEDIVWGDITGDVSYNDLGATMFEVSSYVPFGDGMIFFTDTKAVMYSYETHTLTPMCDIENHLFSGACVIGNEIWVCGSNRKNTSLSAKTNCGGYITRFKMVPKA